MDATPGSWGPGSLVTAAKCILSNGGPPLQPMAKLVYLMLVVTMNSKGKCHPSLSYLATTIGVSAPIIRRNLAQLETAGLITREQTKGRPTVYQLYPPWESRKQAGGRQGGG